ncbi:hypothetical protein B9Z55_013667 [Caenorhabditis nigoni]|uniref:Uncharacterized protein n=1 Tax=Caenorhabditis nigoni TaxID=1611254 RepID=A0A2G5U2N7_9PELO|nr:hypothetical protein B9Z55_013667 [Caenorhabditis nigoni]
MRRKPVISFHGWSEYLCKSIWKQLRIWTSTSAQLEFVGRRTGSTRPATTLYDVPAQDVNKEESSPKCDNYVQAQDGHKTMMHTSQLRTVTKQEAN